MYILTYFTENGSPKTGLSATIRIRDLSDNSLVITDVSMSEVGDGFYKYDFSTYDNTVDYSIRCDGGAVLTDDERYTYASSEFAGETNQILTDTNELQSDWENGGRLDIILDEITTQGDVNESKLDDIQTDLDNPDQYKADTAGLATESNATLNTNTIIAEVNGNETKIDGIISSLSLLVANIWNYTTRTLTAGTKDDEIDDIKAKTDQLNFNGNDVIATLDGETVNIPTIIENQLKYILGLVHNNYRMFDTTLSTINDKEKIVSSKVRIYDSASDCENDTNHLKEWLMEITYDVDGNLSEYKTKEV
jgi:hypothetical protein